MGRVTVRRSKELSNKLKKLRDATQRPVRVELERQAEALTAMMRSFAPDGAGTGAYDLKGTIRWKFGAPEGGSDPVTGRSPATSISVMAGDENNHEARWQEFGTAPFENGGIYKGTQNPGVSPHPFFFTSYRAMKKKIQRALAKAIRTAVQGAAK